MDIHISAYSKTVIPLTNIRECDVKVVPPNLELEKRVKAAIGDCVQADECVHEGQKIRFQFNVAALATSINVSYMLLQLFKDDVLDRRLDVNKFRQRVLEFDTFSSVAIIQLLHVFVRLRFFHTLHQRVWTICIQRRGIWDVHLVQYCHEPTLVFSEALREAKQLKFLWQTRSLWKPNLVKFLKTMISNKIGFSCNMDSIGSFLRIGQVSLDWSVGLCNDPQDYIVLRGAFDQEALLLWHMVLIDDYLEECKFCKIFEKEVQELDWEYMVNRVLKQIPDVWHRGVPEMYKKRFESITLNT